MREGWREGGNPSKAAYLASRLIKARSNYRYKVTQYASSNTGLQQILGLMWICSYSVQYKVTGLPYFSIQSCCRY